MKMKRGNKIKSTINDLDIYGSSVIVEYLA